MSTIHGQGHWVANCETGCGPLSGNNDQPFAGTAVLRITRTSNTTASYWNGQLVSTGSSSVPLVAFSIYFEFLPFATCMGGSFIGSLAIDDASLSGTYCLADYNSDGFVDGIDSDQFNNDFESQDPQQQMHADINGDGFVDGIDYDLFMNAFEAGC